VKEGREEKEQGNLLLLEKRKLTSARCMQLLLQLQSRFWSPVDTACLDCASITPKREILFLNLFKPEPEKVASTFQSMLSPHFD